MFEEKQQLVLASGQESVLPLGFSASPLGFFFWYGEGRLLPGTAMWLTCRKSTALCRGDEFPNSCSCLRPSKKHSLGSSARGRRGALAQVREGGVKMDPDRRWEASKERAVTRNR